MRRWFRVLDAGFEGRSESGNGDAVAASGKRRGEEDGDMNTGE